MKIRFCILMLLLIMSLIGYAQKHGQARVDSLLIALDNATEDNAKHIILLDLMVTYNYFDQQKGLAYKSRAIETANKLKSPTAIANTKNAIGRLYWREGNFQEALNNHNEARQIFERENNKPKLAVTLRYIGQDYADAGQFVAAQHEFLTALTMYQEMDDKLNMAYIYDLLNWLYGKQGNYVEASKYAYTTLRLFESLGDMDNAALAASNIAENYIHLGNYTDALKYFKRSHVVFKAKRDMLNLGYSYTLIGKANKLMGNLSEALVNYDSAIKVGKDFNDDNIVAVSFTGKAEVYRELKDKLKIISNYRDAVKLFKLNSNKYELTKVYNRMGDYFRVSKQYDSAKEYYSKAFLISTSLDSKPLFAEYYKGIEVLDSTTQNWKEAYFNHKKYILNRDSILNQETVRKMVQLQLDYEFDKKEESAKANQQMREARLRNQFLVGGVITTLVFSLVIVLFRNQRKQVKSNQELERKSRSLEEENREKTNILDIVSHDLKAPFDKIKGLTDMMMMEKDMTNEDREQYLKHIKHSIDQGTYLIRKLKEAQHAHDVSNQPKYEWINISKLVDDYQFEINAQLFSKKQELIVDMRDSEILFFSDSIMLTRILDNLVTNASKFSAPGKQIDLSVSLNAEKLTMTVSDEGPGITKEDQAKLFGKFQILSSRPTGGESSTGLGLSITKVLVEKLNGTILVKSTPGEGSMFIVELPVVTIRQGVS